MPWNNYDYKIFRKNDLTGLFDPIGNSATKTYYDQGLTNGKEYCYYVQSEGTYNVGGLLNPLFNKSQELCGVPIDTVPPCPPVLTVKNLCDDPNSANQGPPYRNNLSWTNPNVACAGSDDVVRYNMDGNFTPPTAAFVVPEPGTLSVIALAGAGMIIRRRRD